MLWVFAGIHVIINVSMVPAYLLLLGDAGPTVTTVHGAVVLIGMGMSLRSTAADVSPTLKTLIQALTPVPGMLFAITNGLWAAFEPPEACAFAATCALCLVGAVIFAGRSPDPW